MPQRPFSILVLASAIASLAACTTFVTTEETGDTATDYTDPPDPEPVSYGWTGSVLATPGESLSGSESLVFAAEDGTVLCQLDATLEMVGVLDVCAECLWAFEVTTTTATRSTTDYCDTFRVDEDHGVGGHFGMGLIDDVVDQLLSGNTTTLSPVESATVTWAPEKVDNAASAGTLTYSWPVGTTEYIPTTDTE
jgi:hypothetical protein